MSVIELHNTDYRVWLETQGLINGHLITDKEYGTEFPIVALLAQFTGNIITFEKPNVYFPVKPTHEYFWIKPSLPKNNVNGLGNPVESIYVWQRGVFNGPKVTGMSNGNYSAVRYDQIEGRQLSPMQKPESLMRWLIELHTSPGDLIVDINAGTGTTGKAARDLGRYFVGCENDAEMLVIAQNRLGIPTA